MRNRALLFVAMALLAAILLVALSWEGCGCRRARTLAPPAPDAPEAPLAGPLGGGKGVATQAPPEDHWPDEFKLPLDIHVDAPPVPEGIQGPTPAPQEEGTEKAKSPVK